MTYKLFLSVALLFILFISGCGGGGGVTLVVGSITGAATITENTTVTFSITASGDTGITYLWACDPSSAGTFTAATAATTDFEPALVTADTVVTIQVTVNSDNAGPEVATLTVTVTDVPVIANGWAATWGGTDAEFCEDIFTGVSGNVFAVGSFYGTSDFDPGGGVADLTSNGSGDAYLTSFDTDGNFNWAVTWGGTGYDSGKSVIEDAAGNIYVGGIFEDTVDFNPGAGVENSTSNGFTDCFVCMFDAAGNFLWVGTWGDTQMDNVYSVQVDTSDSVYVVGGFQGTADFDPGSGTENLTSQGLYDCFLSKLNPSGIFQWALAWGGTANDFCHDLILNGTDDIWCAGEFRDTVDFDPGAGVDTFGSNGNGDAFLVMFDSTGTYQWVQTFGGLELDAAHWVELDTSGNIYVSGWFRDIVDFDPSASSEQRTSAGQTDAFISMFDSTGVFQWVLAWGGIGVDKCSALDVNSAGEIYATGNFTDTIDLDPSAASASYTAVDSGDFYISKFDSSQNYVWGRVFGEIGSDVSNGLSLDGNGNVYTCGYFPGSIDFDPSASSDIHVSTGNHDNWILKLLPNGYWE